MVSGRFAVITTLRRGIPELEDMIEAPRDRRRCAGVLALDIPVAEQGAGHPDTTAAIVAASRRAVAERWAEALILACGGMADVARAVQDAVGVPVCDGVGFGAMLAYGLWRTGISTSKTGTYAPPEPIPYTGCEPHRRLTDSAGEDWTCMPCYGIPIGPADVRGAGVRETPRCRLGTSNARRRQDRAAPPA